MFSAVERLLGPLTPEQPAKTHEPRMNQCRNISPDLNMAALMPTPSESETTTGISARLRLSECSMMTPWERHVLSWAFLSLGQRHHGAVRVLMSIALPTLIALRLMFCELVWQLLSIRT